MAITLNTEDRVKKVVSSIMNDYTNVTGIACVYVDIKGKERSNKYNFSKFCQFMRSIPAFRDKCAHCDLCGGLDTFKNQTCCPYRCHAGLVDFAVPVCHNNQIHGFIISGQMASEDTRIPYLQEQTNWQENSYAFHYFKAVPKYRYEDIMSASRILHTLATSYFPFADHRINLSYHVQDLGVAQDADLQHVQRPEIRKTVEYIKNNLTCNLTLRNIAEEVFLSESYLSKLFKQEMKMNLMQYINQCRIQEAEKILKKSKASVDSIGRQLGYHRTSYFCKMFKQFTGETPHAYRKKFDIR